MRIGALTSYSWNNVLMFVLLESHRLNASVCLCVFSTGASHWTLGEPPKGLSGSGPCPLTQILTVENNAPQNESLNSLFITWLCAQLFHGLHHKGQPKSIFKTLPRNPSPPGSHGQLGRYFLFFFVARRPPLKTSPSPSAPGQQIKLIQIMQMAHFCG